MKIAVVGLGYVGLPLVVEFGKKHSVGGFDINAKRVAELQSGQDHTLEMEPEELKRVQFLSYTTDPTTLADCNVFIVIVPTPIDNDKRPDFSPLVKASQTIGRVLKKGDLVIYESTVYPGATEEICIPELEHASNQQFNVDFTVGYSPVRINPGDKRRRLASITKITSGSTPDAADFVDVLYRSIIIAGTHKAPSIKVAEAAKVIENTQRDASIALINKFALIFNHLDIDIRSACMPPAKKPTSSWPTPTATCTTCPPPLSLLTPSSLRAKRGNPRLVTPYHNPARPPSAS